MDSAGTQHNPASPAAAHAAADGPARQPDRQVEVQLGHLCNNRCVFCVSGQLSEQDRAPQLPVEPILAQIRQARRDGATRITLLGGEPTIQRSFARVLREAVALGFAEVVIFTNGVMTPRKTFRDRVLQMLEQLGPEHKRRTVWRFSLQGGHQQAHDATTQNPGSWQRIIDSMEVLHGQGGRLSGNMCVVESNYRSIAALAEVAQRFSLENLHLDMVRPRDSGDRTDAELRAMMARYTDMAPHFQALSERVDALLGPSWDLNFGNVPFCTMPNVLHRIHHDGGDTVTVAADGQGNTQEGFDKYEDKRSDKHKPATCAQCVFNAQCSGVFDKYREFYGDSEFVPITADSLWARDTAGRHFVLLAAPLLRQAAVTIARQDEHAGQLEVRRGPWRLLLHRAPQPEAAAQGPVGHTLTAERFHATVVAGPRELGPAQSALNGLVDAVTKALGGAGPTQASWLAFARRWQAAASPQRAALPVALTTIVERLRGVELAGLAFVSAQAAPDRAVLQWRDDAATLELTVSAARDSQGRTRPAFSHSAVGLDRPRVEAFSRALGERLRAPVA